MPLAKLRLTIPEDVWIGTITREFPDVTTRVLAAFPDESSGVCLAEVTGQRVPAVVEAMAAEEAVDTLDVIQHSEREAIVQFETSLPLMLLPARDSGVPVEMPFDISDGEIVWEVTAPTDRLSALGDQLDAFDIPFTVEYIQQRRTQEQLLTDRQQGLVETAVDRGYYDTPRAVSLTELAAELDIAKSTASETLHRAEEAIVKDFVASLTAFE